MLGPDVFVVSAMWEGTGSTTTANNGLIRCTDVCHRDAAGKWPIVTEYCSAAPKPA